MRPTGPTAAASEWVAFDWRQVQTRQDGKDWKLVAGSYVLADFGADEPAAQQALEVVHFYRFTEHCLLTRGASRCGYFLCQGQAPRGLCFGVPGIPFRPESLTVRPEPGGHVLTDGENTLLHFGEPELAQQLLRAVKDYHFDYLCRIGRAEPHALTFFVRSR
jgi:hypothetical protein